MRQFKYLGSIISKECFRVEIFPRTSQIMVAVIKLRTIWKDRKWEIRLLHALIISVFQCTCESWALTVELQRRIKTSQHLLCWAHPKWGSTRNHQALLKTSCKPSKRKSWNDMDASLKPTIFPLPSYKVPTRTRQREKMTC